MGKTQSENPTVVGWFLELELARERQDFERAAQAKRELQRLGVEVRYKRKSIQQKEIADDQR